MEEKRRGEERGEERTHEEKKNLSTKRITRIRKYKEEREKTQKNLYI